MSCSFSNVECLGLREQEKNYSSLPGYIKSLSDVWNYFLKMKKNTAVHFHCILFLVVLNNQVSKPIFPLLFRGKEEHVNSDCQPGEKFPFLLSPGSQLLLSEHPHTGSG